MFQAINSALECVLEKDKSSSKLFSFLFEIIFKFIVLFGEDVAFGGVFRCSIGLREKYGINQILIIFFIFRI